MTTIIITAAAFALGIFLPTRWGIIGFVAAAIGLFAAQAGIDISSGYGGMAIQDSLAFFGDSWASYIGFNLKVTYRAFALVLLALSVPFIFRLSKVASAERHAQ